MHHSVFTDEYWQFFNPLEDDDPVTMDTAQHAQAAATGPPAWPLRGVVIARPTPTTTHSADGTDDVAAQSGCGRGRCGALLEHNSGVST
jgi:hypothetical protein